MVTITCQHSGIEFEAKTRRTKQHPQIAALKADANKRGNYREVMTALETAKANGGYTTIDEFLAAVKGIIDGKAQKKRDAAQRRATAEAEAKAKRAAQKAAIVAAGYELRTVTEYVDNDNPSDFLDEFVPVEVKRWFSPDGREVSFLRAVEEVERGADVVAQERAAKAAAEKAAEDKKAAEEAAIEAAHNESVTKFDALADEIRSKAQKVKKFDVPSSAQKVASITRGKSSYRALDEIRKCQINRVECWLIIAGTAYDDDGYYTYYCADPAAAGLEPVENETETHIF